MPPLTASLIGYRDKRKTGFSRKKSNLRENLVLIFEFFLLAERQNVVEIMSYNYWLS